MIGFFQVLGGLALFLFGVRMLSAGMEKLAGQVCSLEKEFDHMYWQARQAHIDRLNQGICQPEADVIFMEAFRNLERISDHADNLGVSVMRARVDG